MPTPWPLRLRQTYSRCFSSSSGVAMPSSTRTYAEAIAFLDTLQTNFAIIYAIRKSGCMLNDQAIPEMQECCRKIGYESHELDQLKVIHIAGTRDKGSTAAFVSAILTVSQTTSGTWHEALSRIGLYASPHLCFIRECIQIYGRPLSEDKFAHYFFETWGRLEKAAITAGTDSKDVSAKPLYFGFLNLMAFHTCMSKGVDTAVIECGIGGTYDSTNISERPAVTRFTSLAINHVRVLRGAPEEILWHKSGIMKDGIKCFTLSSQRPPAMEVMEKMASEKGAELVRVETHQAIAKGEVNWGLQADFQMTSSRLAVASIGLPSVYFGGIVDEKQRRAGGNACDA